MKIWRIESCRERKHDFKEECLRKAAFEKSWNLLKYFANRFEYEDVNKKHISRYHQITKSGILILTESWNSHAHFVSRHCFWRAISAVTPTKWNITHHWWLHLVLIRKHLLSNEPKPEQNWEHLLGEEARGSIYRPQLMKGYVLCFVPAGIRPVYKLQSVILLKNRFN